MADTLFRDSMVYSVKNVSQTSSLGGLVIPVFQNSGTTINKATYNELLEAVKNRLQGK